MIKKIKKILRQAQDRAGFTLVELLVVIAIISILTVVSLSSYTSAQIKARDSQRKSDLEAVSKALMMYYNDEGKFPDSFTFGDESVGFTGADGIVYMRKTPIDPKDSPPYVYIYKRSLDEKSFNLFADLENKKDLQCKTTPLWNVNGKTYCYGISSPNATVKNW